ncbi:hypothetical protein [Nocardioides zeicaulis]|uniref:LPXTG cell wall anchor domain-containing protein n=1 Tax=Nocardioides zeicaulis TaxID=1776857 RepID=A0ABV6E4M9_9ACTN
MYNNSVLPATGLAATGMAFEGLWWFLAAFALLAAALAVGRIIPKREG